MSRCPEAAEAKCRARSPDRRQPVVFDGHLALRGTSVARFLGWATGNARASRRQGRRAVRAARADSAGNGRVCRARSGRQPVRDNAQRHRPLPLGRAARAGSLRWKARRSMREPSYRPARALPTCSTSCCTARRRSRPMHSAAVGAKPGWRGSQTDLMLRVNAGQLVNRRARLPRRGRRNGAQGRPSAAAAACGFPATRATAWSLKAASTT